MPDGIQYRICLLFETRSLRVYFSERDRQSAALKISDCE